MRCRKARWYLSARCDGTLSERQRVRLDAHLSACPECRREGFYFSEIGALAERLEKVSVRPDFNLRLRAAIRRVETGESRPAWRRRFIPVIPRPVLALAAATLVVGVGLGAYRFLSPAPGPLAQGKVDAAGELSTSSALPATLTPVEGLTPEMRRLQEQYLAAGRLPENYIVEAVGLNDPTSKKLPTRYVLPTVSTEQVSRKDSF
ncbi:MAG: zf-HC2 domain-containing protein [Candidatus Zixiibacteriota bacterium]